MNRRLSLTLRILVIALIALGLWWFVREMDWEKFRHALRTARLWPLALAALLNFVCLWGKAVCWRMMLAPRHKVSISRLFRYTIATFAASAIAPARAGEVLRVWTLKRRDGVPVADTAAVAVAEKLLDGISMVILVAPVPFLIPGLPGEIALAIGLCAAVAVAVFIALYIAVGRVDSAVPSASHSAVRRFLTRMVCGMHVLRSPKRLFAALGVLLLVWAADLGEVMLVLYAVDIHVSVAAGLLILFSLNLMIIIPSTPAQAGALEYGAMLAINSLHINNEAGLAFALLYHAAQVIPLIAAGLVFEYRLVLGREGEPVEVTVPPAGAAGSTAPAARPTGRVLATAPADATPPPT